jgi:hypothetical protein
MNTPSALICARDHLQRLEFAVSCAELGARMHTISILTGLSVTQLRALLRHAAGNSRGRRPDTREWYHAANLPCRVEASAVVSLFLRLDAAGVAPHIALRGAYRHYAAACRSEPRISFDRAFDLIARTTGRWITGKASFSMIACPACRCAYLTARTDIVPRNNDACPFCKLAKRYGKDARLQASYPTHPLPATVELYRFGPFQPAPQAALQGIQE